MYLICIYFYFKVLVNIHVELHEYWNWEAKSNRRAMFIPDTSFSSPVTKLNGPQNRSRDISYESMTGSCGFCAINVTMTTEVCLSFLQTKPSQIKICVLLPTVPEGQCHDHQTLRCCLNIRMFLYYIRLPKTSRSHKHTVVLIFSAPPKWF